MRRLKDRPGFRALFACESGAAAAEFVLVVPIVIILILGSINVAVMMYASTVLHHAAEDAARCGVVKVDICGDGTEGTDAATITYANTLYVGPATNPVFTADGSGDCFQVSATATYNLSTGLTNTPVALSATACYPKPPPV